MKSSQKHKRRRGRRQMLKNPDRTENLSRNRDSPDVNARDSKESQPGKDKMRCMGLERGYNNRQAEDQDENG